MIVIDSINNVANLNSITFIIIKIDEFERRIK